MRNRTQTMEIPPVPTYDAERQIVHFQGKDYDMQDLKMIIVRDAKNRKHKANTYNKYRKTEQGKIAQKASSKAYYYRQKAKKEEEKRRQEKEAQNPET